MTRRVIEGELSLLGTGVSTCSNELPAPGDRWCAFSRPGEGDAVELWVVNISQGWRQGWRQDSALCEEVSAVCLRLTENVWTGSQLWGPSHPYAHRFDGDTLIFHANAAKDVRDPYEGPVFAWRPGWPAARQLTSDHGVVCTGHRASPAVYCVDSLDVEIDPQGPFSIPEWHAFDLIAGILEADEQPLRLVERILFPTGNARAFRAQFSKLGDGLAYSSVPDGGAFETLRWAVLDPAQSLVPQLVIEDAARWELANDGKLAYILRQHSTDTQLGNLAVIDFPSGSNVRVVATDVSHIDVVDLDGAQNNEARWFGYDRSTPEGETFEFIRDAASLDDRVVAGIDVEAPSVSADGQFTLYYQSSGGFYPVAKVARNDGTGSCVLNTALQAETYGGRFSANGKRVLWTEFGSSGSEEGWSADPTTCGEKVKFGDWVLGALVTGDFIVFEGGDAQDSTSYLQYTRVPTATSEPTIPLVIEREPTYPFVTLREEDATYVLYVAASDEPERRGLFVHGPLEQGIAVP